MLEQNTSTEPSKYINLETVKNITTLSKSHIYALMSDLKFPINGKLKDTNRVVWIRDEVNQYLDDQFIRK